MFRNLAESKSAFSALQENDSVRFDRLSLGTRSGRRFEAEMVCSRYAAGSQSVIQYNIRQRARRRAAGSACAA